MLLLALALAAEPPRAPAPWLADVATYTVTRLSDAEAEVRLRYRFRALDDRWDEQRVADPSLRVLAVTGPAARGPAGVYAVLDPARRAHEVEVVGRVDLQRGTLDLPVLPAARQRVVVEAPGMVADVAGDFDGALAHASRLTVTFAPPSDRPPREERPVVLAELGAAGWAADGALHLRARVRWNVARGETQVFRARLRPLEELQVTGPNLARWERQGDVLVLHARAPVRGRFEVTVEGRAPLPGTPTPLPAPEPLDVLRTDAWWTVGRADEGELVPSPGRRGVAFRQLPEWARGLSDTPAVAAWEGRAPVEVRAVRHEPLPGPDAVVERAAFVVITNPDGRTLVRGTWLVRNERRQFLRLTPPPGFRVLTARVASEATGLSAAPDGGVLVPLPRSVETVKGLVAVPVEVVLLGDGPAWTDRGERAVHAPAVDAPVQEVRWEVHLPRGVRPHGDAQPAPVVYDPRQEAAQAMLDRAVSAYQANAFEDARAVLREMEAAGLANEDTSRLESNLGVLLDSAAAEDAAARRVRDLANAKTYELQSVQAEAEARAEQALREGDTDAAEAWLEQVVELGRQIAPTEQEESGEQADKLAVYGKKLAEVKEKAQKSADRPASASSSRLSANPPTGQGATRAPAAPPPPPAKADVARADDGALAGLEGEATGGVEGGVVGGVMGGVVGGVMAGAVATPAVAPEPMVEPMVEPVVEPVVETVKGETVAASEAAEPSADLLARIPTGRSYQTVTSTAAGVATKDVSRAEVQSREVLVEAKPAPSEPDLPDIEEAGSRIDDEPTTGEATGSSDVEERRRAIVAAAQREPSDRPRRPGGVAAGATVSGDVPEADEAAPPGPPTLAYRVSTPRPAYRVRVPQPEYRVSTPAPPPVRPGATDSCSRAHQLDLPLPPECEGARDAFRVDASAFTVALPLGGPAVGATQALLAADTLPTLTVRFRPDPGESP